MTKKYSLEFAVESSTELRAMDRLKELGINRAYTAKVSDLDHQDGLYFIKTEATKTEMTDEVYSQLITAEDVVILSDELSAERSLSIIEISGVVEKQLKRLLIYVLPETEKVLKSLIEKHQKHISRYTPKSRIEWSRIINNFSFGELPYVLAEDVSKVARDQLLTGHGLLSLISSSESFDGLKSDIANLSESRTVWDSINSTLAKPIPLSHVSASLNDLCGARNDAAHHKTITHERLKKAAKDQKHLMSYIGNVKSSYQENLKVKMKSLTEAIEPIIKSASRIDPIALTEYEQQIADVAKPFKDAISRLGLNLNSPDFVETVRQNPEYQSEIARSLEKVFAKMKKMEGYDELMHQLSKTTFAESMTSYRVDAENLKTEIDEVAQEREAK